MLKAYVALTALLGDIAPALSDADQMERIHESVQTLTSGDSMPIE